ncbi:MFS transporter [Microbacterium sp. B35-30]|uniref:MFS transporter n=1 Tax=Microbacterium sp. B35-30 TaxID=1962642 RepID=UPI0013D47D41|nr:MFS transporter [Microbacterium sp. B35-30]
MVSNDATTVSSPSVSASMSRKAERATWRMSRSERLRYYLSGIGWTTGASIMAFFLSIYLMFQGLSLAAVGTVILIVKIIDAVDDLAIGYFVDRINPAQLKFLRKLAGSGKYLPWYRVTFFLLPLATVLFFAMPSNMPEGAKLAWFAVAYLLFDLAGTLSQLPMYTLVMTLTDRVSERDNLLKMRGVLLLLVGVSVGLVWQFMISEFVGLPISAVAIGSAIIALVLMTPLTRKVVEHNVELKNTDETAPPTYTFREMLKAVRTNKFMLILLASDVVTGVSLTILTTSIFAAFFLFNNSMVLTLPVLIAFIPGLILQFFADRIAHRMGKRNAIVVFALLSAACSLALFFVGPGNLFLVILFMTIGAIPNALHTIMRTFLIPDTIDYTRYKTGQDCAGIFYALDGFVQKATAGVASAIAFFILGLGGWVTIQADSFAELQAQNVTQPDSALAALWITVTLVPALGALACAGVLSLYRLRDADAALMAKCNAGEITRDECEAQISRVY